jgi:hypothetical protein
MNPKIKTKKDFIQIPILIAIIVSIIVAGVIGYGIVNEIENNKKLLRDKSKYTQGIEEFNKGNWEKAKELLSKVSENSPYYQDAKNKIEEVEKKIIEREVTEKVKEIEERKEEEIKEEKTNKDAMRISDISQFATAQEMYYSDKGKYFIASTRSGLPAIGNYLDELHDPSCLHGSCELGVTDYIFLDNSNCPEYYCAYATLEDKGECRVTRYFVSSEKGIKEICDTPPTDGCACW